MKKCLIASVILMVLLLLCACGENQAPEGETVNLVATYVAGEGGYIDGKTTQHKTVNEGGSFATNLVTAVPNDGYRFVGWDDGKMDASRSDLITEGKTFKALFEKYDRALITYQATQGGIILGNSTQQIELGGTTEAVKASAKSGYRFTGWSDGLANEIRYDIADSDKTIIANFELILYGTISYEAREGGRIVGSSVQMLELGEKTEEICAIADTGYRFMGWSDGVMEPARSDIVEGNKSVYATFSDGVNIVYQATQGGTLSGELSQRILWDKLSSEVVAVPAEGYKFVEWSDGVKTASRQDGAVVDLNVTAIFKRYYVVNFASYNENRGIIEGTTSQEIIEGMDGDFVSAVPADGYQFVCWSNGETNASIYVNGKENATYYAYFCEKSAGLPVVSITTENGVGITSKETYVNCIITVLDTEDDTYHICEQTARIKGRGNSTWDRFDKKPYKIKFDTKQNLFDNGKAKDWVLLADYIDNALIRNMLAYEVAEELDTLCATPDCQSVEVYLNGEYRGVYLLCEQIEINNHRVEICEDETLVDTGYLVEMDGWTDTVQVKVPDQLKSDRKYTIKAPDSDVITAEQKAFIQQYLKDCIAAIRGDDYERVKELLEVESFAEGYIIYELFKNPDTNYSSLYFYKDAGGKLVCGPVWDFDMSIGNVNHKGNGVFESTETLWSKENCPWFNALLNHEEFVALVGEKLLKYSTVIRETLARKYDYIYAHADAYKKNFEKWDVIGKNTWTNPPYIVEIETWEEHVEYTRQYLENSLSYLIEYYCE